ncbi:MAG TPA: monofunctional biosynthetic peptidoglycan transglycosylase [Stellaceae bacterium]|nr:monofunctional biosynthetic peptidoglycan transglycosylase [Stellaceae bacterium]
MHRPLAAKGRRGIRLPAAVRILGLTILGLILLPYLLTPLYAVVQPVSTLMIWRRITGEPVHRTYVPIGKISNNLKLAVLIAEDGRFCEHYGVDFAEIRDAIQDADSLEDVRGGSTITQQVAKNLFLWPQRSYLRKALEFPLALWVDLILSKRRILEIYLNVAEWGPSGQFGAEAGAEFAFHKSARSLSAYQAALLAATLPNPHEREPGHPSPELRRLAELYVARAARAPQTAACVR